jgi:FAD/FMN-containing dehydrogenase
MPETTVANWFGDIVSHPQVVVEANSVQDVVNILKNPAQYPSPVRAIGSNHSTAPCGTADGGTVIKMGKMNAIVEITSDTVTAQAGALYIDVAIALEQHKLQHFVNTEIGCLSVGSAACCRANLARLVRTSPRYKWYCPPATSSRSARISRN